MMRMVRLASLILLALLITACATTPKKDLALERVRTTLQALKDDPELSGFAPLALGDAERALRQAENSAVSDTHRIHLIYMADRRIKIARAQAQQERLEQEYDDLERERNRMLVKASQEEVELARMEAEKARIESAATSEEAERARQEARAAQLKGEQAEQAAEQAAEEALTARRLADARSQQVELARREAELAHQQVSTLKQQLENLQLRQTESGVVVTLGDVLFESGATELRNGALNNLGEVVDLLQSEPDKKIRIEGHTDTVGSADSNIVLSEKRAKAVEQALISLGIDEARMTAVGLGEEFPIASNETEEGRSQNRRVDVILLDSL